jgi:hypothetical protein
VITLRLGCMVESTAIVEQRTQIASIQGRGTVHAPETGHEALMPGFMQ